MNVDALYIVIAMIAVTSFGGLGLLVLEDRRARRVLKRDLERTHRR